jgi:hypothetical protein
LMSVKQQRQMEFGRHGDVPGLQYQSYREGCGCEVWERRGATRSQQFHGAEFYGAVCLLTQLPMAVSTSWAMVSSIAP